MITALSWLPKEASKAVADAIEPLSKEEIKKILNEMDEEEVIEDQDEEVANAKVVAKSFRKSCKGASSSSTDADEVVNFLKELDMDNYDEENDDGGMEDLISQLPDDLLHKILLNFSTKESVRTSVLSTRWRYLCQSIPGLIFDGYERDLTDFVDIFLNLRKESQIYEFTLRYFAAIVPCWKIFIDQVLNRGIQLLKIDAFMYYESSGLGRIELPVSFYTCESLVNLDLTCVRLDDFDGSSKIINLPHLQVMNLQHVSIPSDVVLEMLISCSPVLQILRLYDVAVQPVKVRSHTLRRLNLIGMIPTWLGFGGKSVVVIDTPNLEFLNINSTPLEYFRIESVSSSINICVDVRFGGNDDFSNMQTLHKFFAGISEVTYLNISARTLKGIYNIYSKMEHQQLPVFKNLIRLSACFFDSLSEMLPMYLSSCPNLKSIVLELRGYPKMEKIANCPVPQCLLTSIEIVEIKMVPLFEISPKAAIEFAKYILENATTLKKFTLSLIEEEDVCSSVFEQILRFRTSPFVEVKMHRAIL